MQGLVGNQLISVAAPGIVDQIVDGVSGKRKVEEGFFYTHAFHLHHLHWVRASPNPY